jgi:endonuclease/exonuclease/phosphatase family metal-dependent hydrolase
MVRVVLYLILFFGALTLLLYFLANPSGGLTSYVTDTSIPNKKPFKKGDTLTVLTFNMAYGYGIGSDGVGYKPKPKEMIYERLKNIALLIKDSNADLVLLQEVDFDASRSGNRNQVDFLLEHTGFNYAASAVSWDARYVPFPYLPISSHFGKVKSGGAILSRFPIVNQTTDFLPKPDSNPWYYNWFYLHRYIQTIQIDLGDSKVSFMNMHLEAYDVKNKALQARRLTELVKNQSDLIFFGGDLNSLPPNASQVSNFNDDYGDDYSADSTQIIIRSISNYTEPKKNNSLESDYFTFPPILPNRQLDYLFVQDSIQVLRYEVLNTGDLSDHRPILLTIRL